MRVLALLLVLILAAPLSAADRQRIATINVAATSLFTYLGCLVQKQVRSGRDAAKCFGVGAIAGAGFYQAKRFAAQGDITRGWLIANAASSLVENTTAGEHPLSRIGYTFGPLRLRLVTPLDEKRESLIDLDLSIVETGFLVRAIDDADDIDVRDGMIWYETKGPDIVNGRVLHGYTWGIYPGTWSAAREHTWNHEAVHAVQALQLDSVEPPLLTFPRGSRWIRLRHIRAGAVHLSDNLFHGQRPYRDRWVEIEAYRLTLDREPPP
jgi:hypothetical protein